jgi:CHAT domain-containing protein
MKKPQRLDFSGGVVDYLLARPSRAAQRRCLSKILAGLGDEQAGALAEELKERVVSNLFTDIQAALAASSLILYLAKRTGDERHLALGLRARAQTLLIGLGEPRKALRLYQQALAIHEKRGDRLGQALVFTTSIWAMANVGQYERAEKAGEWSAQVLKEYGQWRTYGTLMNNLSTIHNLYWNYRKALDCIEEAQRVYVMLGDEARLILATNEVNRALALCQLGSFDESIKASQFAMVLAVGQDQKIVYARAQHNMAITYFIMGRYNHALNLLNQARDAHVAAGQEHEAGLCDIDIINCLLMLNRMEAAIEKCAETIKLFSALGMHMWASEAARYQAQAYLSLEQVPEAISVLQTARSLLEIENMQQFVVTTDLEIAQIHLRTQQPALALEIAQNCIARFKAQGSLLDTIQARLVAARALMQMGEYEQCRGLVEAELEEGILEKWPELTFQAYHILARSLLSAGRKQEAFEGFAQAVVLLERLRSQVMLEFRSSFLVGRETIYAEIIGLCIELGDTSRALEYAERARSHAMLELLLGKVSLSLRARQPGDEPLVERIRQLQSERQQYSRRLDFLALNTASWEDNETTELKQKVWAVEKEITDLWHGLIIRNTDYEQDAALWVAHPESQTVFELEPGSLLLEYFSLEDHLVLFLVFPDSAEHVEVFHLQADLAQVEQMMHSFQLNLAAVPVSTPQTCRSLEANAQKLLSRLYQMLLAPIAEVISGYPGLIIVPYGELHYVPFHALYDGSHYLIEAHTIRYLPTTGLLHPPERKPTFSKKMLVVGNSFQGCLPAILEEARCVAKLWNADLLLEEQARLDQLRSTCAYYQIIHLACHGDFRPDNPLFSGLALGDGWLNTLDIFSLSLSADLVTLSACQTGRGTIGGGDELAGMMRAFLSSGAKSLVLSLWAVNDQVTSRLMNSFYRNLASGADKATALRQAQYEILRGEQADCSQYSHPFFWAPFFLVGDGGVLSPGCTPLS